MLLNLADDLRRLNPVTEIQNSVGGNFSAASSPIHIETSFHLVQTWRVAVSVGNKLSLQWRLQAASISELKVSSCVGINLVNL